MAAFHRSESPPVVRRWVVGERVLRVGAGAHDEALHEARKSAKRARYAAEALAPLWPDAGDYTRAVKRLQAQGLLDAHEELSETGKPRTYYALTVEGHEQLALKRDEWRSTRALVDQFAVPTGDAQPSPAAQPSHEQDQVPS